ncbi:MAG: hypothetical protein HZA16_11340 [Nitrospirae bacterium]|nr:hypothetical protein [Nitrospirota bacterium]
MNREKLVAFFMLIAAVLLSGPSVSSADIDAVERNSPLSEYSRPLVAADENMTSFMREDGQMGAGYRCGTLPPTLQEAEEVQKAIGEFMKRQTIQTLPCIVDIPVVFHILRYNDGTTGDVTDQQVNDQLDVLNNAYASTNFRFVLDSIERVNNTVWSQMRTSASESAAKQALAISPAVTLNIYTCTDCQGNLGWSYLPNSFPEGNYMHGVVALYSSFPGGSASPYNEGDTVTHEAGHYLGLYHTFEGGCAAPGDYINDTPYEASAAFGCPAVRDTCSSAGPDPIYNFMDYTDDACMDHFTTDQGERIDSSVALYKPSLISCVPISGADLTVSGIAANPATPAPGQTVNVTVTVKNQGDTAAEGFNIDFFKNLASAPGPGQNGDFRCSRTGLAAGATTDCTGTISYASGGAYRMWAFVDPDQYVVESNESNNIFGPQDIVVQKTHYEENESVGYTGRWSDYNCVPCSGGKLKISSRTGAKATFTFSGTGIKWMAAKTRQLGIAKVYVDGVLQTTVDLYSATNRVKQVVFQKTGLASGSHTIVIDVTGTKNAASTGQTIDIDAFDVVL